MISMVDDPQSLRLRAADWQARADRAVMPEIKQALSRIADDYEVLAKRAEQRIAWWSAKSQDQSGAAEAPAVEPPRLDDQSGSAAT